MPSYRLRHHSRRFYGVCRAWLLLITAAVLALSPVVALAQAVPPTIWIPPYVPSQVPAGAPEAVATVASPQAASHLIIDTDPGVDDAVALAWLFNNVPPQNILGIVTVAGNTTVENATKNVYTLLGLAGVNVPVVQGAKKPWSEKLSSNGKLIHGPDGLWGMPEPTLPIKPLKNARDFYCSNARQNPGATILALGPLTNIAEAIRHCRRDMANYERIVVLGGVKLGGQTTPVAEFNIWQDPKSAQAVFDFGRETATSMEVVVPPGIPVKIPLHKVDVVPLDAFKQLEFTPVDLLGISLGQPGDDPFAIFATCPSPEAVTNIFSTSSLPIFQSIAYSVCKYAQTQFFAQFGAPGPVANIPDLVAAIYTMKGLATAVLPAVVEVIERPDSVRGQTIIGINQGEQLVMATTDKELDAVADLATEVGILDPIVQQKLLELAAKIQTNADIVWMINPVAMRGELFSISVTATDSEPDAAADEVDQGTLPERLYLPSVGVE